MKTKLLAAVLILCAFALGQRTTKSLIKVSHMSTTEVGITCLNNADPTGFKVGDTLVISCGH